MAEFRVHIDTLNYTRQGLQTKTPLTLPAGQAHRVVLVRPDRVRLLEPGVNGFAFNSSFPTPGVLQLFLVPELRAQLGEALVEGEQFVQVFGHTDETGDEAANKTVSERRAKSVLAMLTGDVEAFAAVAQEEQWGLAEAQIMLRALRCDPGPADGKMGPLTARAVEVFQNQFNSAMFHRHLEAESPSSIPVTCVLDRATFDALLDSFVSTISPRVEEARLHPTHPSAGCSEYNLFGDDPRRNRRVSLVLHRSLPLHHDAAPCQAGDHMACPVQEGEKTGCMWYREHYIELNEHALSQRHFDLRWLFVSESRALLSAVTTVEDGSEVVFRVYRSPEVAELEDLSIDSLGEPLSAPIIGKVLNGVAYCEWSFDAAQAQHLSHETWVTPIPYERALEQNLFSVTPTARVPVFTVTAGGATELSRPPLHDVCRCVWHEDHVFDEPRYVWMTDMLGRVHHALFGQRSVDTELRALATSVHAAVLPLK